MGFCFSCCRRQKIRASNDEQQSLLGSTGSPSTSHHERGDIFLRIADMLGALRAGKLPSQQQLDVIIKALLRSEFLSSDGIQTMGYNAELEHINTMGIEIIVDLRMILETVLEIGLEKNNDNKLQDIIYLYNKLEPIPLKVENNVEVEVDSQNLEYLNTAASAIPPKEEAASDVQELVSAIFSLSIQIMTISTFRLILSDLFLSTREYVANVASAIKNAARTVEEIGAEIENNARPSNEIGYITQASELHITVPSLPDRKVVHPAVKDSFLAQVETILLQAQTSPQCRTALRTLINLLRKYAERVEIISSAIHKAGNGIGKTQVGITVPVMIPDPKFQQLLQDTKTILERFACGRKLDTLLDSLFEFVEHAFRPLNSEQADSAIVQQFLRRVGLFMDDAISKPSFVSSRQGRELASKLYDEGFDILSESDLTRDLDHLLKEVQLFIDALKNDRTTTKLFSALDKLQNDIHTLIKSAMRAGMHNLNHWRSTLIRNIVGWVLPKFLHIIHAIPMPRVEYISIPGDGSRLEVAVDALLLSAEESLIPDAITVQEYADIRIDVDERLGATGFTNPNIRLLNAQSDLENGTLDNVPTPAVTNSHNPTTSSRRTRASTTSRVKIQVEGLRLAAKHVGYYVSYARGWLGFSDEGLVDIEIGRGTKRGEGLAIEIELDVGSTNKNADEKLFQVLNVNSALPGLRIRLANSKHFILNSLLLAPLAGPIGRMVGPKIISSQIRGILEMVEEKTRMIARKAEAKSKARGVDGSNGVLKDIYDLWSSLIECFSAKKEDNEQEDEEPEQEPEVYVESYTNLNLTGVTHTSISQVEPEPGMDEVDAPSENLLAVGIGAQLLPGKAEPTDLRPSSVKDITHGLTNTAIQAIENIQSTASDTITKGRDVGDSVIDDAVHTRMEVQEAQIRLKRRRSSESKKKGWRSKFFDI